MSRTTLCILTAATLAVVSIGVMTTRYVVLGSEVTSPAGPGTWKVTLVVRGNSKGDAHLLTLAPLDMGRQHVLKEEFSSAQMMHLPQDTKHHDYRPIVWTRRTSEKDGPFRARSEFYVSLEVAHPSTSMVRAANGLYAAPHAGEFLDREVRTEADNDLLEAKAKALTAGLESKADQAEALYRFVENEIQNDPSLDGPPIRSSDCLRAGSGDSGAKSRLLVALLRHCGIPARPVLGLSLHKGPEQRRHFWVEAWVRDRWVPMDSFQRHFGSVPGSYLVFAVGHGAVVRGRNITDLDYAFLIERASIGELDGVQASPLKKLFRSAALHLLPPPEQHLVEFLLLLPVAALVICIYRNLIGLISFGTFAPALVGLAFRDLHGLPGIFVFVSILLIGWIMRRVLNPYHLLQVPRIAVMLSLIVIVLIVGVVAANHYDLPATKYFSLFPMIILTGMVERFWTLETEDGTTASFKTLLTTMLISGTIALVVCIPAAGAAPVLLPGDGAAHRCRAGVDRPLHRLSAAGAVPLPGLRAGPAAVFAGDGVMPMIGLRIRYFLAKGVAGAEVLRSPGRYTGASEYLSPGHPTLVTE